MGKGPLHPACPHRDRLLQHRCPRRAADYDRRLLEHWTGRFHDLRWIHRCYSCVRTQCAVPLSLTSHCYGADGFAGCAFGYVALRSLGLYFAIITLSFSLVIRQVVVAFPDVTGGLLGIFDVTPPQPLPYLGELGDWERSKLYPYYLILVLLLLTYLLMHRIEHSRFGMVLRAAAQSETLTKSVGISVTKYRLIAFTIACSLGGLSGAYATHYHMLIHPDYYTLWVSIYILVYVMFGGIKSIFGTILGTTALIGGMEMLQFTMDLRAVIYAGVIIVVTMFLPGGIVSLPGAVKRLLRRR